MTLDRRILNRVTGYWPGYRMTPQAISAWEHKLEGFDPTAVLAALDEFSDELATPPRAGQLAARIQPPAKPDGHETEQQRCSRQRAYARDCVKAGRMSKRDFDFYAPYWDAHDPQTKGSK